jgi:glucosamine--fructose-6-phosphate aminotransferase (isomerizing)
MTHMLAEALQAPQAVANQLAHDGQQYAEFGNLLRVQNPNAVLTVARGSSDHAAQFLAYLVMARMGRLVTSLPMSLITLYHSQMACRGLVSLAFSQSGQSPDLVAPTHFFRNGGAITAAFANQPDSPLAQAA